MTLGGWIIMLISVSSVTSLFCWCIYKVLSTPEEEEDTRFRNRDARYRALYQLCCHTHGKLKSNSSSTRNCQG